MVVQELTAQSWNDNVLSSKLPVIVNFTAVRCGFCKALEPLYSKLSDQYGDRLTFYRLVVDFPANHQILNKVAIQGTPTLKFYCKGREVGEHVGYAIEPVLKKKIDESLQEMESCLANSTPVGR
ncbi:MAG: thioredoxin family protein [Nitrososphaera sp.]|jgi:thioredoxin 1